MLVEFSRKKFKSEGGPSCIQICFKIMAWKNGWRRIDPLVCIFVMLMLLHAAAACCFTLDKTISTDFRRSLSQMTNLDMPLLNCPHGVRLSRT